MANKYTGSGPSRAKNRPNSKDKVAARRTARKESGMSAQKFYVKTRMAEAAKSGKTLDRAALRKKFQSGEVTRKGFGAPKKKTGETGSSSTGSSSTVKDSRKNPATKNMQGVRGYVPGKVQKSAKSNKKAAIMSPQEMYPEQFRNVPGATKNKFTPYKP